MPDHTDYYLAPCHFRFSQVSLDRTRRRKPAKAVVARQDHMIRVPDGLYQRLTRIGAEILAAKERGQGYDDVPLVEQGVRGVWVSFAAVIERALDELENKKARSNPRRSTKPRKRTPKKQ
jgi:hypothetical protein